MYPRRDDWSWAAQALPGKTGERRWLAQGCPLPSGPVPTLQGGAKPASAGPEPYPQVCLSVSLSLSKLAPVSKYVNQKAIHGSHCGQNIKVTLPGRYRIKKLS